MRPSKRLERLTSAFFSEMNQRKRKVEETGIKVIDLGIGSPDQPPSPELIEAIVKAVQNPDNYQYPTSEGSLAFRKAVAKWYAFRFGVEVDPENEVLSLMGSQDGLAHLAQGWIDQGDVVLVPDPGYPIYAASVEMAGGELYPMPLIEENNYLPNLDRIPADICRRAKMIILNYPNNPLAATADLEFFQQVISFAKLHDILVVHDFAYSELTFEGYIPPSILEVEGAKEVAIEFNSLSKSFNMAGCRIAYVVGRSENLKPLAIVKSNIDYGVFLAVQEMAITALEMDINRNRANSNIGLYQKRRDLFLDGLAELGWVIPKPKATMFIWAKVPNGWSSTDFSYSLLERAGVLVIPGHAFGTQGEGYVRMALVQEEDVLRNVIVRIKESGILM